MQRARRAARERRGERREQGNDGRGRARAAPRGRCAAARRRSATSQAGRADTAAGAATRRTQSWARRLGGSAARRLGGSAARRLGGSAARRLGGSAARRLGGSAARRLGGSAARRLGGSANIVTGAPPALVNPLRGIACDESPGPASAAPTPTRLQLTSPPMAVPPPRRRPRLMRCASHRRSHPCFPPPIYAQYIKRGSQVKSEQQGAAIPAGAGRRCVRRAGAAGLGVQ